MVGEHSGKVVFHLLLHNGTGLPDDYDGHDDYDDDNDEIKNTLSMQEKAGWPRRRKKIKMEKEVADNAIKVVEVVKGKMIKMTNHKLIMVTKAKHKMVKISSQSSFSSHEYQHSL